MKVYKGKHRIGLIKEERERIWGMFVHERPAPHELILLVDATAGASGRVADRAWCYFRGEYRSWCS
jgi:hypothetical protein